MPHLRPGGLLGVSLHARAGERLDERMGLLGYLARDIPGEIPALMKHLVR